MPNVVTVLKQEIARIAAKQSRAAVAPVRKSTVAARTALADLKRRVAALEKAGMALLSTAERLQAAVPAPAPEEPDTARITAKGMRSLRKRLGLSAAELGKLVGVTGQAVYAWEGSSSGALRVRPKTRVAILAIRELGAREVREMLAGTQKGVKTRENGGVFPHGTGKARARRAAAPKVRKVVAKRRKAGKRK